MKVAVIGAGLAGSACAYFLSRAGVSVHVYERSAGAASGASGNVYGLYNPRFFAEFSPQAQFYAYAFVQAKLLFEGLGDRIDYHPCGVLHVINSDQKKVRFAKMLKSWPASLVRMEHYSAVQASLKANVMVEDECLYLPDGGMISPYKLCQNYLTDPGVQAHFNRPINQADLNKLRTEYDHVIVACSYQLKEFEETQALPVNPIRGQVSYITPSDVSKQLKCVVCYAGYVTPAFVGDQHVVGSTFHRGVAHFEMLGSDHDEILRRWHTAMPSCTSASDVQGGRSAVRAAAPDHMPIIGALEKGLSVSTAHGSHGILSSLMGAKILTAQIAGTPLPVNETVLAPLSPHRFV